MGARTLLTNPATGIASGYERTEGGGVRLFQRTDDWTPFIEANKVSQAAFDPVAARRRNHARFRHVARIPNVIVLYLKQQGVWGDQRLMLRWLSDPSNRLFRTDDARRLA